METSNLSGQKITIRSLLPKDIKIPEKFQCFINSLVVEEAMLLIKTKKSKKNEAEYLSAIIKKIKDHKMVCLIAEADDKIIGKTTIELRREREDHVAEFGISIRNGYRGMGLGFYLTKKIIALAKKDLKPKPKFIRLSVFQGNIPAYYLYKKMGFQRVAKIPQQVQYNGKLIDEIVMLLKV